MPALRVLVVEDNPTTGETLSAELRRAGFDVETATTAAAALDRLAGRRFHAIVADLRLPESARFDTMAALRARAPDSRIVVCSGVLTEELRRLFVEAVAGSRAA